MIHMLSGLRAVLLVTTNTPCGCKLAAVVSIEAGLGTSLWGYFQEKFHGVYQANTRHTSCNILRTGEQQLRPSTPATALVAYPPASALSKSA